MTTETLSPNPWFRGVDTNGNSLAFGKLFTYAAGTSTKLATYTDSTGVTPNTNPVILDSTGQASIWLTPNVAYKFVLSPSTDTDPPTAAIRTQDQIVNAQLLTLYGGVDTGAVNAFILNFTAAFSAYSDGLVIFWIPSHTNTGPSTINVNGLGAVAIVNQDGSALTTNQIIANQSATILYKGGQFYLTTVQYASGTFTGTLTGCTTAPTATFNWTRTGNIIVVDLSVGLSATSNTTTCTITGLPSLIQPARTQAIPIVSVIDNSVGGLVGYISFAPASGTMTLALGATSGTRLQVSPGNFTAAGTKGLGTGLTTVSYSIV